MYKCRPGWPDILFDQNHYAILLSDIGIMEEVLWSCNAWWNICHFDITYSYLFLLLYLTNKSLHRTTYQGASMTITCQSSVFNHWDVLSTFQHYHTLSPYLYLLCSKNWATNNVATYLCSPLTSLVQIQCTEVLLISKSGHPNIYTLTKSCTEIDQRQRCKESSNYHYQSKICESPFLRLNYLEPPAQMQWGGGHRFSYKWENNKTSSIHIFYLTIN
jgi:hypothetical protein